MRYESGFGIGFLLLSVSSLSSLVLILGIRPVPLGCIFFLP